MYEAIGQAQVNKEATVYTVLDIREPKLSEEESHDQMLGRWAQ